MTDKRPASHRHPYYIAAPDYRESSAGVRVMHRLCHLLNERGCEAYLVGAEKLGPNLNTPRLKHATAARHRRENRQPIAVYTDIVTGNPLNAPVCVRYMLNKEGVIDGNPINAGPEDLFFYYSRAFTPNTHDRFDYLRLNTHDLELFKPDPDIRKMGPLLYINRIPESGIDFSRLPDDVEIISNQTPLSLDALAHKLQAATVLYSFEKSATCTLAMLCGCPVVAMTLTGYEHLGFDAQSLSPYGGRGYALTDSEEALEKARATLPAFRQALSRLEHSLQQELDVFIAKTQAKADETAASEKDAPHDESHAGPEIVDDDHLERIYQRVAERLASSRIDLTIVIIGDDSQTDPATLDSLQAQRFGGFSVEHPRSTPQSPTEPSLRDLLGAICQDRTGNGEGPAWLVLIDNGDRLQPEATTKIAQHCSDHPALHWLHSDATALQSDGTSTALYPPDAGPRLIRSGFALPGVLVVRADVLATSLDHANGLSGENWRQALPYLLLTSAPAESFSHIAETWVTHGRMPVGSPDLFTPMPPTADHSSNGKDPAVSIIIPTRDQAQILQRCLESIFEQTRNCSFEVIVIDHETSDPTARDFLTGLGQAAPDRINVIREHGPFNFPRLINSGVRHASGRFLLLLNNDTAALHPEWLQQMLAELDDPTVGIVGPRLVFPDGRIQHAGAILGLSGAVDYPWVGASMEHSGYLGLLSLAREVSAVSGAAMLVRRSLFERLGGMDEEYSIAFGDIDLCLRASDAGFRCIWTPHATLMHETGFTLKSVFSAPQAATEAEKAFLAARSRLLKRWLPQLAQDRYYNVNLSLNTRGFEPEAEPALRPFDALEKARPRVLALPADDSGPGMYRVIQPAQKANRSQRCTARLATGYPNAIQLERLGIQTLFSQRQVDDNHLQVLAALRQSLPDLRLVMDFDDLLTKLPRRSHYRSTVWKDMPRRLHALGQLCDCFTVSTAPLARAMRAYHEDVRHIPNGLDPNVWANKRNHPRTQGKLRVGWIGGISHEGDLEVVRSVVKALSREIDWVFFGMHLKGTESLLHDFIPAVPFADYPERMASLELDLAIAPLEINPFNECKSNLRLLEYGVLGIPVIATNTTPYQCGLPVTLVDNQPRSWIQAIRDRIGERGALQHEGERLRKAVLCDWTLDHFLADWVKAWRE